MPYHASSYHCLDVKCESRLPHSLQRPAHAALRPARREQNAATSFPGLLADIPGQGNPQARNTPRPVPLTWRWLRPLKRTWVDKKKKKCTLADAGL